MSDNVFVTTDENFATDVLEASTLVLVDFWAPWCGPCKMIAPVLEEVARDYQGRVKIVKVNVDENQEMPTKYGVRSIPNLVLFKEGDVVASHVGSLSKPQLAAFLDENL